MNLGKIISISGKPGLYRIVSQSKSGFIVEELESNKKTAISAQYQVSLLENIAIYTQNEEVILTEVFQKIANFTKYESAIHHKESSNKLREYMEQIMPEYDKERVYDSDLKKLFLWFNLLLKVGVIKKESAKKDTAKKATKRAASKKTKSEE